MSLGSDLLKTRESKKITLETVSEKTRIPVKYLEAIERDQFDVFPSQAHAKGFIRAYGKVIGADAVDLMTQFKAQVEPVSIKITPPMPEGEGSSAFSFPWPSKSSSSSSTAKPQAPADEPVVEREAPQPVVRRSKPARRKITWPKLPGFRFWKNAAWTAISVFLVVVVFWSAIRMDRAFKHWRASKPVTTQSVVSVSADGVAVRDKYQHLILKGLQQSWILVTMDDGQSTSEINLAPGEVKSYKALHDFKLKIGNAGGVDARFNGKSLGVLGVTGQVVELSLPSGETTTVTGGS
ncbi:MAG: helix-turn-helix domain-containing protein [bacterium]